MPQVLSAQVKPIHATLLLQLPDGLPARANESCDDAVGVGADGAIHGAPGALRGERALGLGPRAEGRLDGTLRRVMVAEADVAPVGTGHGQAIDLLGLAERVYTSVHQVLVRKRIHVDLAVCRCRIHLGTPRHRHLVDVQHQRDRLLALALALALASSVAPSVASSVASSVADSVAVLAPLEAVLPEAVPPLLVAVVAPPPVVLPIAILVTVPVASFSVTVSIPVSISIPAPVAVVGTAAVVLLAVRKLAPTAAVAQTSTEVVTRVRAVATLTVTVTVTITVIAPIPSPIVLLGIHLLLALAASGRDDQRPSCDLLPHELVGCVLGRGVVSEPHLRDAPHRTIHLLGGQHVDAHEHARLDRTMQEGRNICGRPSGGKFPDLHEGLGRCRRLVELDLELRAVELLDGRPGDLRVFEASNGLVAQIEDLRRIGERTEDLQLGSNLGLEPVGGQIHPRLGEAAHHNILALCGEVEPVLAPAPRLRAIAHDVPRPSTDMADARLVPDLDVTRWVRVEAIWPRARDALPADTL
mmetsp:Transcript_106717/g.271011  ORF Transcript_106717/g.271011 Transcript_106717/m.271011 type:complete len:528 (+) Transcript_106717:955-2538(+)